MIEIASQHIVCCLAAISSLFANVIGVGEKGLIISRTSSTNSRLHARRGRTTGETSACVEVSLGWLNTIKAP
jgi:hypothetical protein